MYGRFKLRWIAENYFELRCYAEDGRNAWQQITGETGLTDSSWMSVVEELADFDTALNFIGKTWKMQKIAEDSRFRITNSEVGQMLRFLNKGE